MKTKIYKILGVALTLVLVFSLVGMFAPANRAEADAYTPNQWNVLSTPSSAGNVLASGSNIVDFAVAPDGTTIYLINDDSDPDKDGVYKSTNGGSSFSALTLPSGLATPKLVAVAPDDPNAVAVVDDADEEVFISNNGGATWASLDTPAADEVISDIAVSPARSGTLLGRDYVVSTYNTTGWGDVYVAGSTSAWSGEASRAGFTSYDFTSVALAPNWTGDRVVLAVGSDASAGGTTEQGAGGDSFLIAINVATHAAAGPQKVRLDAAASDSPAARGFASLSSNATWSTDKFHSGSYSAKLNFDNAHVCVDIPNPTAGYTIADLDAAAAADFGFWYYQTAASEYGPQLELKFGDPNSAAFVDITLMLQSNTTLDEWTGVTLSSTFGAIGTWDGTTSNIYASLDAALTALSGQSDYELTNVRVELYKDYEGMPSRICYVDDVTIAGRTYDLEKPDAPGTIVSSSIALPSDFDSTSVGGFRAYVGWTSEKSGGVTVCSDDAYRVDFNSVRKLEVRPAVPVYSLSYFGTVGSGTLMVGETDSTNIWTSTDPMSGMPTWGAGSAKRPTGTNNTIVAMISETEAFAARRKMVG